jgi:dTDP-4-dehydrorhamnose reductase
LRIVIIGASGLIGSALEHAARAAGHEVIGTFTTRPRPGLLRFDLTCDELYDLVPDLSPDDVVYLMSAQVDQVWMAHHAAEARRINVDGAIACAQAALGRDARLIYMSTEAVFGTGRAEGFDEMAFPTPMSLYARHKVEVESFLRERPSRWSIARTGSNVGWDNDSRCSVSATYRTLLGPDAKMAYDNLFTVTDVNDVAVGLLRLIEHKSFKFIHLAANPPVIRTQLANWIIAFSRFGKRMSYDAVPLSSISIKRSGGGRAWLRNALAVRELDLTFAPPEVTVRRKVSLLDRALENEPIGK